VQPAFWDGGVTWRVRFSPAQEGEWRWRSYCQDGPVAGFTPDTGEFTCTSYHGENPFYRHGPLQLSADRRHLVHRDGTPFFWLADTAWNGVIRGDDAKWEEYLALRAQQGFSVIQYVSGSWRGDALDELGEASYIGQDPIQINAAYFQRIDRRAAMINAFGLLAAPVVLWSLLPTDPGYLLSEADATRLAEYIIARYGAYQLVWLLGGDGNYQEIGVERWKRIGRHLFGERHDRLVALHPCGQNWVGEEFRGEPWYDIIGYQSGHGDLLEHIEWLVKGPPAVEWQQEPALPVINMEPNYENAVGYHHHTLYDDFHVRRAVYWSLLVSPTAGVTYGHDAIWNWNAETGPSEGHGNWHNGAVPPWHTGLQTEGIRSMSVMRDLMERLDWTQLAPCPEVLAQQPGDDNIQCFIAAAKTPEGRMVVYAPCGGTVTFTVDAPIPQPVNVVDPRSGEVHPAQVKQGVISLPDQRDWLAVCGYPIC
jgi:hypothetical protein